MLVHKLVPHIHHDVLLDLMLASYSQDPQLVERVSINPYLSAATVAKYWEVFQPAAVAKSVVTASLDPNIVGLLLHKNEQRLSVLEAIAQTWKLPVSQAGIVVKRWPKTNLDRLVGLFRNHPAGLLTARVPAMASDTQLQWLVEGGCAHVDEEYVWNVLVEVAETRRPSAVPIAQMAQILCLYPKLRSRVLASDNLLLWNSVVYAPFSGEELKQWVSKIVDAVLESLRDARHVALGVLRRPDLDDDTYSWLRQTLAQNGGEQIRLLGPTHNYRVIRGVPLSECNDPDQVLAYLQQLRSGWFTNGIQVSVMIYLLREIASNPVVWENVEIRKFIQQETNWASLRGSLQSVPPEIVPVLQELRDMPWHNSFTNPGQTLLDEFLLSGDSNQNKVMSEPLRYNQPSALMLGETNDSSISNVGAVEHLTQQEIGFHRSVGAASVALWLVDQLGDGSTPESKQQWGTVFMLLVDWQRSFGELVDVAKRIS